MLLSGRKLLSWWKKHVFDSSPGRNVVLFTDASTGGLLTTTPPTTVLAEPATVPAVPRRRRRRRRSRDSIVGLPLYSEDPADAEMTLFKHRPSMDSRGDLADDTLDDLDYDPAESTLSLAPSPPSRPRSTSISAGPHAVLPAPSNYDVESILANEAEHIQLSQAQSQLDSSSFRGHRASRSTPGTPSMLAPPSPTIGRNRASTLRSIFNRNGSSSSLVPGVSGRSPYGQFGSAASRSTTRMASASSSSIASLSISSPLPHTLVSSAFVFPKAGLTPEQVSFISSRESLGAYGYGAGAELPPPFVDETLPAPTFVTRGRRSSSVTSMSPLRRYSSSNPLEASAIPTTGSATYLSPHSTLGRTSFSSESPRNSTDSDLPHILPEIGSTSAGSEIPTSSLPRLDRMESSYFTQRARSGTIASISEGRLGDYPHSNNPETPSIVVP